MVFKVGETVVYPHHGAALIEAIETRTIKGEEKKYLVLKVAQGDLTVRVPADNAEIVGVRDVVGQEGLDRVFEVLRAPHRGADQLVAPVQGEPREARVGRREQGGRGRPRPLAPGEGPRPVRG
jgi:RNA polymerase-interacting CarD/CdnL/TRCF family regulator